MSTSMKIQRQIMAKTFFSLRSFPVMTCCRFVNFRSFTKPCACFQQNVSIIGPLAKMMKRADKKMKKKKETWQDKEISAKLLNVPNATKNARKGPTEGAKRRAHQVSFVLYDYITQIMYSGELSPKIASLSIEITEVKVLPDFSCIHVYWAPRGSEQDEEIKELLKINQGRLRTLLTSYRPISKIPEIVFKADTSLSEMHKVSRLLEEADYGEEETVTESQHPEKLCDQDKTKRLQEISHSFEGGETKVVYMGVNDQLKNEDLELFHIEDKHDQNNHFQNSKNSDIIKMIKKEFRNDIYGLNHSLLMEKIKLSKHKLKHRKTDESDFIELPVDTDDSTIWDKSMVNKLPHARKHRDRKYASKLNRRGGTVSEYLDELEHSDY